MFTPHIMPKGVDPWELQPAGTGLTLHVGTALVLAEGKLAKCGATAKPTFVCMADAASTKAGQMVPVMRVLPDTVWETELSVISAGIQPGKKYTLDSSAEKITATDASGVAEVVSFDGTAAGSKVRVRFA